MQLPRPSQVPHPFYFKTHPLGGFFVSHSTLASPLKEFFEDPEKQFLLTHAGRRYSRGLWYYPGLTKDLSEIQKITFTISKLRQIINAFVAESCRHVPDSVYPAIAQDYVRNYLLILYYAFHTVIYRQHMTDRSQTHIDIEALNGLLKSTILSNEINLFAYIVKPEAPPRIPVKDLRILCSKLLHFFNENQDTLATVKAKVIRESREADNLAHTYSFACKVTTCHLPNETTLLGLEYGGIELPFAVNAVRVMQQKQVLPFLTLRLSNYSDTSSLSIHKLQELVPFASEQAAIGQAKYAFVLDDASTTGRSLEKAVRLLPDHIQAAYVGVVSFRVSNRFHHVTMPDHGGLNPIIARNSVILCRSNYTSTYKKNSYLNRSGIFDLTKYNLYKILGKEMR